MAIGIDSDWLVADSEDEDEFTEFAQVNDSGAPALTQSTTAGNLTLSDSSVIQTGVFSTYRARTPQQGRQSSPTLADESLFTPPKEDGMDSTIGDFTNANSTSGAFSEAHPRPRVVMKKAATSDHNTNAAHTPLSHISDPPISRQTNESILPAWDTSVLPSETVDDAYSSFDIAERAKLRSRKSQTTKKPVYTPYQANEVIELTSDEDELVLKSTKRQKKQVNAVLKPKVPTKPRPKPTLKVKPTAALPGGLGSSRTVDQVHEAPPGRCAISQLPVSTVPTVPPSTPPQPRELTPLSSPPVVIRKRKRIHPSIAEDDDEMDITGSTPGVTPLPKQPPPFFAASSSSLPTDSGVEVSHIEPPSGRGKKERASSSKKGTRARSQNKGKRGKKLEISCTVDEVAEEPTKITKVSPTSAAEHAPSVAIDCYSSVAGKSTAGKKTSGRQTEMESGKARKINPYEERDEPAPLFKSDTVRTPPVGERENEGRKENLRPDDTNPPQRNPPPEHTSTSGLRGSSLKPKLTSMSELIQRANSQPSSPFPNATRTYSPLLKSSRAMLSRIAPLHPNRRTPPPPMPRPPPPRKTKKQLEMEERIEEELSETIDGWICLTDDERKALRKARIDAELGYE